MTIHIDEALPLSSDIFVTYFHVFRWVSYQFISFLFSFFFSLTICLTQWICYRVIDRPTHIHSLRSIPGMSRGGGYSPWKGVRGTCIPKYRHYDIAYYCYIIVPTGLQNPRDRGTAGPRKKLTPAENFQNWKKKKKPSQKKMKKLT